MNAADIIAALALPPESRVDKRVAKKLLLENGAPTAADKRQINEGIEELTWLAALKPTTIGVPEYQDEVREYLEIAVLSLKLRPAAKRSRLIELIHRAIPYPLFLISAQADTVALSTAHKRYAQNEAAKTVLDEGVVVAEVDAAAPGSTLPPLNLSSLPRTNLWLLYQGWLECLESMLAARITGRLAPADGSDAALARRAALYEHKRLVGEITAIRARAERESQIPRRVELNLELKRLETALTQATKRL